MRSRCGQEALVTGLVIIVFFIVQPNQPLRPAHVTDRNSTGHACVSIFIDPHLGPAHDLVIGNGRVQFELARDDVRVFIESFPGDRVRCAGDRRAEGGDSSAQDTRPG